MRKDEHQPKTNVRPRVESEPPAGKRKPNALKSFAAPTIVSTGRVDVVTGFTF